MFTRSPLLSFAMTALGASASVACTVNTPEPGPEATSSTATAVVVVERMAGPGDQIRTDAVGARFVRVRQGLVDDPALRMAGVAEELPALGTCAVPSDGAPTVTGRSVELLDVGQVTLVADVKSTTLLPRTMPDPAGVLSGVVYSSRSADVFAPGASVLLRAGGGPDLVDGFSIQVTAPRDVADVRVTSSGAAYDVAWDAADADVHDVVYVDLLSASSRVLVRCTSFDAAGRLSLPIAATDDAFVAVHRLHKESFKAKGIEPGEVRFDVARVVALHR